MQNDTDLSKWLGVAAEKIAPFRTHALCVGGMTEAEIRTIRLTGTVLGGVQHAETIGHLWRSCGTPVPILARMVCSDGSSVDPVTHARAVLSEHLNQLQTVAA